MVRAKTGGGNRTDLLTPKPAVKGPGQPNGRPQLPNGLPYGEKAPLQAQLSSIPKRRGRPMPVEPAGEDMVTPGTPGHARTMDAIANWQPQVNPLQGPAQPTGMPRMSGFIGQPDSIFGPPGPGNVGDLLAQLGQITGSAETQSLAARLQASGT